MFIQLALELRGYSIFRAVLLIFLLYCFGVNNLLMAEMYKWLDADGNTHYTQHPPPAGIEGKTIKPPPKVNSETARKLLENRQKHLNQLRDDRNKSVDTQMKAQQEDDNQRAACEQAKASLASFQRPRVNLLDKDGNSRRATEEERLSKLATSQEAVNKLCK